MQNVVLDGMENAILMRMARTLKEPLFCRSLIEGTLKVWRSALAGPFIYFHKMKNYDMILSDLITNYLLFL